MIFLTNLPAISFDVVIKQGKMITKKLSDGLPKSNEERSGISKLVNFSP